MTGPSSERCARCGCTREEHDRGKAIGRAACAERQHGCVEFQATGPSSERTADLDLAQLAFENLAHRLHKAGHVTEAEAMTLYDAAGSLWDDAIHVAAPWEKRVSLCGNWGRNLVSFDDVRPDFVSGCWTCLKTAKWLADLVARNQQLQETLADALNCKGAYGGTVSESGGSPALCPKCASNARDALRAGTP